MCESKKRREERQSILHTNRNGRWYKQHFRLWASTVGQTEGEWETEKCEKAEQTIRCKVQHPVWDSSADFMANKCPFRFNWRTIYNKHKTATLTRRRERVVACSTVHFLIQFNRPMYQHFFYSPCAIPISLDSTVIGRSETNGRK